MEYNHCKASSVALFLKGRNVCAETKTLVNNMSGIAKPGTLTAIMGPSGAGKTTLLNLLSGFYDTGYEGEVQINGYVRDQQLFNKQSCYVMQEDRLLPELTVEEAITMSVELRMPMLDKDDKRDKVDQSIQEWGLDECRKTRTSSLSGGQRRRLAIAQELVNNPPVVFLDEPTSGLDNVSSLMCVQIMKEMAENGHTVICSIHTPSAKIFSHFDKLYMVSHGRCIYNGHVDDLLGFLSRHELHCPNYHNPADFVSEIAAGDYGDYTEELSKEFLMALPVENGSVHSKRRTTYGGKIMSEQVVTLHTSNTNAVIFSVQTKAEAMKLYSFKTNSFHQFGVLLKRCWLSVARNKVATPLRFVAYAAFAIMMIMLYYDIGRRASTVINNANMFFGMCCIVMFQSILPTVIVFPIELSVLLRENRNCWYSVRMYYLAHYITEIPFLVIPVIMLIALIYYPTSQPLDMWRVAGLALFSIQLCSVTQAFGLIVSAVTKLQTAVFVALPAVSPSFFFSGFFVQAHLVSPYVRWLTYLSPMHYAYHGMLLSVYGYDRPPLACDEFICLYENPAEFLQFTGTSDKKFYVLVLSLVAFEVVFRVIAFILLKYRLTKKE
ncbi:ABC transporter, putative [Ixodes scapularis]|uniref:ABC transporter, putative n=1 Tax=Ixodes scapularis TaxID=6945 RepID=B7PIA5_IXOSC|nr:ABC transporter, putative [Ixodes scapularis]|eukprot:XP_002404741.1 ABC transporter, putative [Ixodes scapularis]